MSAVQAVWLGPVASLKPSCLSRVLVTVDDLEGCLQFDMLRTKHALQQAFRSLSGTLCLQGTGTADEMALEERTTISTEGCVIADVAIVRPRDPPPQLQASTSSQDSSAAPAEAQAGVRPAAHVLMTPPPQI